MRMAALVGSFLLISIPLAGQPSVPSSAHVAANAARPATGQAAVHFDAADVHVRPHTGGPRTFMSGGVLRGGRYDLRNVTMLNLIMVAYSVDPATIVGGPNWLDRNQFDIIAKAPDGTPRDTLQAMVKTLLADRFKLVVHNDTRPVPSYVLTVMPTGHKMTASKGDGSSGCESTSTPPPANGPPPVALTCKAVTMAEFADLLRGWGNGYVDTRTADQTNLSGKWDFNVTWAARNALGLAGGSGGVPLFQALEQQLGLKLQLQKAPAAVLVVDSVNERPTENPSGVAEDLPPPPVAEFDIADVKLAPPDARPSFPGFQAGGRIDVQGFTMHQLVNLAWGISDDELVAGAPKWYDDNRYSIVARTTTAITSDANGITGIDIGDLQLMLRALLVQRFNIKTHTETRPVTAYTLVADKPKLQPADPANRTNWINGPAPGQKDPRDTNPGLNRFVTCQNMTMAQFAEDLAAIAGGYIKEPVLDATGLPGAYDFTLNFSGIIRVQQAAQQRAADGGAAPGAADPSGVLSLFDAMERQVGLKLQKERRPFPVLVIDSIDEKPSDN